MAEPNPKEAEEPCSACGRMGVLFSTRQMKIGPAKRKCLECNVRTGPAFPATGGLPEGVPLMDNAFATGSQGTDFPAIPFPAAEPCSACGRENVFFSQQQMQFAPSMRRCLDCVQTFGGAGAEMNNNNISASRVAGMGYDDVEGFISIHGLDEAAAHALRQLPPEQQRVITEVGLSNCRNPSAVVQSRIHSLGFSLSGAVENYIADFALDERCAAELRSLTPHEQRQVIETQPTNARNPSAVVSSRINAVRSQNSHVPAFHGHQPMSFLGQQTTFPSHQQATFPSQTTFHSNLLPSAHIPASAQAATLAGSTVPCGRDLPKPCIASEPCSKCGRTGALFSKRQMKVDPSARRCLDCMLNQNPELAGTTQAALGMNRFGFTASTAGTSGGVAQTAELVAFIKHGVRLSTDFTSSWMLYCRVWGHGTSDPTKYDAGYLKGFIDHGAKLVQLDLSSQVSEAAHESLKRPAGSDTLEQPVTKKMVSVRKSIIDEVHRLNKEGGLSSPIRLTAIAGPLSHLEEEVALGLLAMVVQTEGIEDPTQFICSQAEHLNQLKGTE